MRKVFLIGSLIFILGLLVGFNSVILGQDSKEDILRQGIGDDFSVGSKESEDKFLEEEGKENPLAGSDEFFPLEDELNKDAEKEAKPLPLPQSQSSYTSPDVSINNEHEEIFQKMDMIDLSIARVEREIRLAELEVQKLELLSKQQELKDKLQGIPTQSSITETSCPSGTCATPAVSFPEPVVPEQVPEPVIEVLSIIAFGEDKLAYLRIATRIEEVKEGDTIIGLDQQPIKVVAIEPQAEAVVIEDGGQEKRYYAITGISQ